MTFVKYKNNLLSDANQREFLGMCNDVRYIKKYLFQTSSQDPSDNKDNTVVNEDTRFSVNQLVVVKQDESQFRVSYISKEKGEVKYFSSKHHKASNEDEIEDFEKYWESKKRSN
jgi:hypothetical protein